MQTANIETLRKGVAEYMGTATMPLGNQKAYDNSIKAGLDYCWRYATWAFAVKRDVPLTAVTVAGVTSYYMPNDFDILGWRDLGVEEYSTTDGETPEQYGYPVSGVYLMYDEGQSKFKVVGGNANMRVAYQVKPPELNAVITFPALDPLFQAGAIYAKQKDMPNSAEVTQMWDILHTQLDQLAGQAYFNTPHHKPRNRYEKFGTFIGDTR